jgi:tetratricopeptide (TPR) repeat protein
MVLRLVLQEGSPGQVVVGLQRSGQLMVEASGAPVVLSHGFDGPALEDLRWYLEEYLAAPFAVYEERGQGIEQKLKSWGEGLFAAVFGDGKPGRTAYIRARESAGAELVVMGTSVSFLSLPWELLKDPLRATPLALELGAIDRLVPSEAEAVEPDGASEGLRVLMVIARPSGLGDIGYQMIARPLLERLEAVRGKVELAVLRPPTLDALKATLAEAASEGRPYHILHFDGHGTFGTRAAGSAGAHQYDSGGARGYVVFEKEGGGADFVPAEEFGLVVNQARVPLVVLNACRSGWVGEAAAEAAVATRVLEGGAGSVVAMGYSVYAVAASEFMAAFYETLFAGKTVSTAVAEGRRRLYLRKERPSPKGPLPLEDWIVPVHYTRRPLSFPHLRQQRAAAAPSLDTMLDTLRGKAAPEAAAEAPAADQLAPVGRFIGRDNDFYRLELVLQWQRVAVVHGPGGTGKTELAKAFGRWWQASGGVEQPQWVFFHSFEPGVASFGLDGMVTAIGLGLFGPDFIGRTQGPEERRELVLKLLHEHRMLLIWDNFESVYSMPDPSGATPPLKEEQRERVRAFVAALASGGKSGLIITSRTPEPWLGEVRRLELGGLNAAEAAELAGEVLKPYPVAQARRHDRAYAELMEWLDGHPLSLRLLLPQLEDMAPAHLLATLKGEVASLPPGFEGAGRLAALGASVKYSFDHLDGALQQSLPALALFEGVVDQDVLALFSEADGVPARFAGVSKAAWAERLERLARLGLLTGVGGGMYEIHPALPAYLMAQWRLMAGEGFDAERAAADRALLHAYAGFGSWLQDQIDSGVAEAAFALIERQRRAMGRLVALALADKSYAEAQRLLEPLNAFWNVRGLGLEAKCWVDRCRVALETADGTPPDLDTETGALWLLMVSSQANRAYFGGDLAAAEAAHDAIRRRLEASTGAARDKRLAVAYHQLGMVARGRGDLAAAEDWSRKSLVISETLGDRSGMASTYHQLGVAAQQRGDFVVAEDWYRKALPIIEAMGDRLGMATSYYQLGTVAQQRGDLAGAEDWYRKALAIDEALGDRTGMSQGYHQLGIVAQQRGDFGGAEDWYRQSLAISEALGNRLGMAKSYGQLGLLAVARGKPALALDWVIRCIALFPEFPHPATGPGPHHLAQLTAQLGMPALEAGWRKCNGSELPPHVRSEVSRMIADKKT